MKLALMYSARCNAACAHCSTSCGPHRTEQLSREKIFSLMDEAAALSKDEPLKFGITGGEPFLDFEWLCDIVAYGQRLGAEMGCVSNGYWASSDEKAHSLLSRLKEAGLHVLSLSYSRFHQAYVHSRRVELALRTASTLGLQCELKVVRSRSDGVDEETIRNWAREAGAARVEIFSVLPHLREGAELPPREYQRRLGLPAGPCPGTLTTVSWDGEAYACAMPGAFQPYFSLGNVHRRTLESIQARQDLSGKQQILRSLGPIHFAREIQQRGLGHRLRKAYIGVCDLCTHIGSDPLMAPLAEAAAERFEIEQLQRILGLPAGFEPAESFRGPCSTLKSPTARELQ